MHYGFMSILLKMDFLSCLFQIEFKLLKQYKIPLLEIL